MVLRDIITQVTQDRESDGQGGYISKGDPKYTDIECKASFNTSPEVATAYGPKGEQVLYVVTRQPLEKGAFYLFESKKYAVRFQTNNSRLYFTTLIEIKGGQPNV